MKLRLINFLCYNDSTFDLGESGMTLISGVSGIGKSSIMKGILFALFGDGTKVQLHGKPSCSVELEFDDIKIIRTKRPNRLILNEVYEDEAAQEIINKKFGDTFKTSGYIQQNNLSSFILLSPTDKLEFLETFAFKNLDLGKIKARCKAYIQKMNDELTGTIGELNMATQFLKDMELPKKIEFPIKCSKTQYEKVEKNEIIKHKNILTMIKRKNVEKIDKQTALNDLKILEATVNSKKEQIESIESKLLIIKDKSESIFYYGDKNLEKLKNDLITLISQRELNIMEKQHECDSLKLQKMREQELRDFHEELVKINDILWKKYKKDEIEHQKKESKSIIADLEKAYRLYKEIEENYVNEKDLDINKQKLKNYIEELDQKQDLYRKLLLQKEVYKCPSCLVSLRLIEDKLSLSELELNDNMNNCNIEKICIEIEVFKRDIVKLQKNILDKESKLILLEKSKNSIQEILSSYEEIPSVEDLVDEIQDMKDELDNIIGYQNMQVAYEKRKTIIEDSINNEILSKSYLSFKISVEKLYKKIDIYKSKITGEFIEREEEDLRMEISKEKVSKDNLNRIKEEEENLKKEREKCICILEKVESEYLFKYQNKYERNEIEQIINNYNNEIEELELKKIEHINNLQKIEEWKKYQEYIKKYENWKDKVKELDEKEKEDRKKYSAAMTLKDNILQAESISICNIIDSINIHARQYLDDFFQDNPICVTLQAFKQNKKKVEKPCINMEILYKDMEADINMLSGGELTRVILAYTLSLNEIFNTPILLLDESTASLDQDLTNSVFESIRENFTGKLVIVVGHQIVGGSFDKVLNLPL